ncbi:MAG: hypothetical protein JXM79_23915 [Sedimentisphaerales bacterium]|nr:hypothetical protein [Sedimentisphaerales bacterium]
MRIFCFIFKRWCQLIWSGEKPAAGIDVRKWSEQIESVNRTLGKHR